jgi:NAD(P)-dependent dehydrogenase (short-subunit alcohol dehydrogenase family)
MTRALAEELGGLGIRVNCVLPGWMETAFTAGVGDSVREAAREASVLRRVNEPEEVARGILGLHGMPGVSGQVMALDGRPLRVF